MRTRPEETILHRAERIGAIVIVAILALGHLELRRHVGPLWRDEAATVNVATMPTLRELWSGLEFDSFPALVALSIRAVVAIFGSSDAVLRTLGLLVGLALIAALCWNVRAITRNPPLLSLALLSGSWALVRYGDSMRGYGLGTVLILIALGLLGRLVEETSPRSIALALLFSLLSIQALYQNSVLLLAACCGGIAVGVLRRSWKLSVGFLGIGLACGLSLLPYAAIVARTRDWNVLMKRPVGFAEIWLRFVESVDPFGSVLAWTWVALLAGALVVCGHRVLARGEAVTARDRERALFLGTVGLVGAGGHVAFLRALSYEPRTWYFVPIIGVVAATLDAALDPAIRSRGALRVLRLAAALALTAVASFQVWPTLRTRQSRVDLAAIELRSASKDDVIVVDPWEYGISFARYYRGSAPWTTLPPLTDHRTHRYDLVKRAMIDQSEIERVFAGVATTLRSGHRVWIIAQRAVPPSEAGAHGLPPPPLEEFGWQVAPYALQWSEQLYYLIWNHALRWAVRPLPTDRPINPHEDLALLTFEGWRD